MPDSVRQLPDLPADWPNNASSKFVMAAGLRWHVQRAGTGPVLVLVHGTAGATHTWRTLFPLLTPWADVIAFDLPGHGFTSGATTAQLSLTGMADAVADLLDALAVRQPVIGVGHSAGAAVLLQLAASHDFALQTFIGINSALVSINALGQLLLPLSRELVEIDVMRLGVAALMRNGWIARELLRSTGTPLDSVQAARYVSMLTSDARVESVLRMMTRWDLPALHATFSALRCPVTLVHSSNEPWVPYRELLDVTAPMPDRTVIDLAPAGHLLPDEKPHALADIIASASGSVSTRAG